MDLKGKLIDLHIHLDGSLSADAVKKLASMQNIDISDTAKDNTALMSKLQVSEGCRDLNEYLEKFDFPLTLMQTGEALEEGIYLLLKEQKNQGLIYSEIRFAPQLHIKNGLNQKEVVEAVLGGRQRAKADFDMDCGIILCCMRGADNSLNEDTLYVASHMMKAGKGVVAVDLAGAEKLFPTSGYETLFELAKELKLPFTIHAGEADGSESIWKALEFGASRIGHGIRAVEDKSLMKELARRQIPLELCPTSNLNTRVSDNIGEYPIMKLINEGVTVTINTDNMTVSGTTLADELNLIKNAFNLPDGELLKLLLNSARAVFPNPDMENEFKTKLIDKILQ